MQANQHSNIPQTGQFRSQGISKGWRLREYLPWSISHRSGVELDIREMAIEQPGASVIFSATNPFVSHKSDSRSMSQKDAEPNVFSQAEARMTLNVS